MNVGIIGAGAAGMFCAGKCAEYGHSVTLFEKNEKPGRKLAITGKGRCNVTNDCDINTFLENIPTNPRFLYKAITLFSPQDTMDFFTSHGVPLKTERGNRVFPVSDKAYDIVDCLKKFCLDSGVKFICSQVDSVEQENGIIKGIVSKGIFHEFDAVVICTGGKSYPLTGSTGDGFEFAKKLGLETVPPKPSLVPIETVEKTSDLMGLSLKNVSLSVFKKQNSKPVYSDFGEMLFTHFGLSGPMILSCSSHLRSISPDDYYVSIDLKPALDHKKLDSRVLSDFSALQNKNYSNALSGLLPLKLIPFFIERSGISPDKKVNSITRDERKIIVELLKDLRFTLKKFRPIDEAIITSGGVSVKEINPSTMESKKIRGLYFAGEIIDVDAHTGGFNLQIAFCTSNLAAQSISKNEE